MAVLDELSGGAWASDVIARYQDQGIGVADRLSKYDCSNSLKSESEESRSAGSGPRWRRPRPVLSAPNPGGR